MPAAGYLVQYGHPAFVGRFTTHGLTAARGQCVVLRTPRGIELGEVLCEADGRLGEGLESAGGDLLRIATPDDLAESEGHTGVARDLLAAAGDGVETACLPLSVLDVELLFDGSGAILHVVPWATCQADVLLSDLSNRFGMTVRLLDLTRATGTMDPPEPAPTCGKPDCGSGGCSSCGSGCSTGSCSRGTVTAADDLTAYFAELRARMEADSPRTPLH